MATCKTQHRMSHHSGKGSTGGAGGAPKLGMSADMNASAAEMSLPQAERLKVKLCWFVHEGPMFPTLQKGHAEKPPTKSPGALRSVHLHLFGTVSCRCMA